MSRKSPVTREEKASKHRRQFGFNDKWRQFRITGTDRPRPCFRECIPMSALRDFIELLKQGDIAPPGPGLHVGAPVPAPGPGAPAPGAPPAVPPPARVLKSIKIEPKDPTLFVGEQWGFIALGTFSDGSTMEVTTEIIWSSSPNGVVSIDYKGSVTPNVAGNVTITATDPNDPGVSASTDVTVEAPGVLESIEI